MANRDLVRIRDKFLDAFETLAFKNSQLRLKSFLEYACKIQTSESLDLIQWTTIIDPSVVHELNRIHTSLLQNQELDHTGRYGAWILVSRDIRHYYNCLEDKGVAVENLRLYSVEVFKTISLEMVNEWDLIYDKLDRIIERALPLSSKVKTVKKRRSCLSWLFCGN